MTKSANASSMKALRLLDLFTPATPCLTLDNIASMSGLPRATAFRMINSLVASGLIDVVNGSPGPRQYRLGLRLLELGHIVAELMEVRVVALPHMMKLRDEVGEAVQLLVMDGDEAVYIEKVEPAEPVRMYTRVGRRAPPYAGACPRALIAFLPGEELEVILDRLELKPFTPKTITDRKVLERQIQREGAQGYTISHGELCEGSSAIGMPVRDRTGKVVASISVAGPESHFSGARLSVLVDGLKRCVDAVSKDLGYRTSLTTCGGSGK